MKTNNREASIALIRFDRKYVYVICCLLLCGLKLWLISGDEIVARNMPHDQLWFIKAANYLINLEWLGPYDHFTLLRQPGYPLWVWLVHLSGIPLRLATELLLILSAFVFSVSLIKARFPIWISLIIYIALLFHPFSFILNNESLSETLYAPLLLLALSGMFFLLTLPTGRKPLGVSLLVGFALAILWNTRQENLLIAIYLGFFGLLAFILLRKRNEPRNRILKNLIVVILIPMSLIIVSTFAIKMLNYLKYGVFVTSEMSSPGFVAANKALMLIKTTHPRRYVPVPKETRKQVYSFSPSFKELEPYLEGVSLKGYIDFGCKSNQVCDDFSAGWFIPAFRDATSLAKRSDSATEMDKFYQNISDEIHMACSNGRVSCKKSNPLISIFLHPYPSTYLPYIPDAFYQLIQTFLQPILIKNRGDYIDSDSDSVRSLFNTVANRRTSFANSMNIVEGKIPSNFRNKVRHFIGIIYGPSVKFLTYLALFGGLLLMLLTFFRKWRIQDTHLIPILILLFVVISSRMALFTLWKVCVSFQLNVPRYLYPVAGLYACFVISLLYFELQNIITFTRNRLYRKGKPLLTPPFG